MLSLSVAAVCGYLAGSIPFGVIVGRAAGIDPRSAGSGNIGATNVFRLLGARAGAAVLALDAAKGFGPPAIVARMAGPDEALAAGVAAIVGHVFPIFLGLRGGKGVATSAGALLALAPLATLCAVAVFVATLAATRYVSLASILAALALPTAVAVLSGASVLLVAAASGAALVIARHRANIGRLLAGTEPRAGQGAKAENTSSVGP